MSDQPIIMQGPAGPMGPAGMMGPMGIPGPNYLTNHTPIYLDNGQEMKFGDVIDFMQIMKERMLILTPNFEKHEKYPALKELYDQYRVMERLINDDHNPKV